MARFAEIGLLAVAVALVGVFLYDFGTVSEGFKRENIPQSEVTNSAFTRRYEYFESLGTKIEAWLYIPKGTPNPPVVILAPGLGLQKHFKLDIVAESFAKKGIAAFVFDYRFFGGSEGEPRNSIKVSQQIADYHAAIKHVTTLSELNSQKIGLWGTSFSGGHVLTAAIEQVARKNPNVTCVVSRAPHLDSLDVLTQGTPIPVLLKRLAVAVKDLVLSFFGKYQYVPIYGDADSLSVVTANANDVKEATGAKDGALGWHNLVPARAFLELVLYRPYLYTSSVSVPTLIVYSKDDTTVSAVKIEDAAADNKNITLLQVSGSHWEIFNNKNVLEKETDFFAKHLLN